MSGSAANHVDMHSPVSSSGCACAVGVGDLGATVTILWLVGGALVACGRRRHRRA